MNIRRPSLRPLPLVLALACLPAQAAPSLIAIGELSGSSAGAFADLSGLNGSLENGAAANLLGGIGSGLAWAGGNTFLALPDRGPNAVAYNTLVDNTTSYISRFQTVTLDLTATASGGLPATLTAKLSGTTLLSSTQPLTYGSTVPMQNGAGSYYFTGRSDNFNPASGSLNTFNARLDPEGIRVSNDGKSVFVSDEYGPYVYQFDRATGVRTRTFNLPSNYGVSNLSSQGALEISGNTTGRVANKGMEGLAIAPDGRTLVGFMQSPLAQDGGDGGRANRIVSIDIASGGIKEYVYDNRVGSKNYNSSEILALNASQFLVLERDGKGLGDGSNAALKQLYMVTLDDAHDIAGQGLTGETTLLTRAVAKTLFLDLRTALNAKGISDANIPAKLEGAAFGQDITINGQLMHTLYIANDNDFIQGSAGTNKFFVFGFTDADLNGASLQLQSIAAVPEPGEWAMLLAGFGLIGSIAMHRGRRSRG